jgi:hypothetical protein
MENQSLQQMVSFLAPFLPYLLKMGEKAAEEAGKKLGEAAWEQAKALWSRLRSQVESKPAALEAVKDLADAPDDADAQAALRFQLKKLLTEDPALLGEVTTIISELKVEMVTESGKVIGVWVTTPKGRLFIQNKTQTGDVSGQVTGVRYKG